MRIQLLFSLFILSSFQILQAARPTVNASNIFNNTTGCTNATISWSNGNGNARMIVAREGSPVSFVPSDYSQYGSGNSVFRGSTPVGQNNDEYILMNAVGMSSLNITNLKSGSTYYFAIYEHDHNGSNTLYLTSGAATYSFATYYINQNFSITVNDSCEASNQFVFNNTSSTSIPGLVFNFVIYGDTFNADQALTYSYKNKFGMASVSLINNNKYACSASISKQVKLFPKKMVSFDFANSSDTVQDFIGNYFSIRTLPKSAPFPMSVSYQWSTGDGDSTVFNTLRYSYNDVGRFHSRLITTASVKNKSTGCKDTMYLDLVVTGFKPFRNLMITPDTMELSTNLFSYSLSDTMIKEVLWQFGDGDTSHRKTITHSYKDTGNYMVTVTATTLSGKIASTTKKLRVNLDSNDSNTSISKLPIVGVQIYPNPAQALLTIEFDKLDNVTIELIDAMGRICWFEKQRSLKENIDLRQLAEGLYTVKIYSDKKTPYSKMIQIKH